MLYGGNRSKRRRLNEAAQQSSVSFIEGSEKPQATELQVHAVLFGAHQRQENVDRGLIVHRLKDLKRYSFVAPYPPGAFDRLGNSTTASHSRSYHPVLRALTSHSHQRQENVDRGLIVHRLKDLKRYSFVAMGVELVVKASADPLTKFLIHRAHLIDSETALQPLILDLIIPSV
jgi:hypothetical protein